MFWDLGCVVVVVVVEWWWCQDLVMNECIQREAVRGEVDVS